MSNVELKLREIVINHSENSFPVEEINLNESISTYVDNSLSFIKMIVSIENEFSIDFEDEDLNIKKFPTLQCMLQYIENKLDDTININNRSD